MSADPVCDVCVGYGSPVSGIPCICGGTGKSADEKTGLRRKVHEMELQVNDLQKIIDSLRMDLSVQIGEAAAAQEERNEANRLNRELRAVLEAVLAEYCITGEADSCHKCGPRDSHNPGCVLEIAWDTIRNTSQRPKHEAVCGVCKDPIDPKHLNAAKCRECGGYSHQLCWAAHNLNQCKIEKREGRS